VLTDLTTESGNFWFEAAIDLLAIGDGMIGVSVATRILIRTYKFSTANKTLLP